MNSPTKLWQHDDTGRIVIARKQPSHRYFEIPTMHEDELPDDITIGLYAWWFDNSFVDVVRVGPKI